MGWYKECSAHFINLRGVSRTKEECIEDAKKYTTIKPILMYMRSHLDYLTLLKFI